MLLLLALACAPTPPVEEQPRFTDDWAVLVWMPYDNDLGPAAAPVVSQLQEGTLAGVRVMVQADLPGPGGMMRYDLRDGMAFPHRLDSDHADLASFRAFLDHAATVLDARRYAIVMLDHGGRPDELGLDEYPTRQWLDAGEAGQAVTDFREREPGEVELVFLQMCARANLATLYAFRTAAQTVLASQVALAAPNTWYRPVLQDLTADDGVGLARAIASADGTDMWASYTCMHAAHLHDLPAALEPVLATPPRPIGDELMPVAHVYAGDTYVDLGAALRGATDADALRQWARRATCFVETSDRPPPGLLVGYPDPRLLSGLSVSTGPEGELTGLSRWTAEVMRP
jgi:hypothetical protein